MNECAETVESIAQLKAFIQYTQIKEPKTELGRRVVALWKDFSTFWKQKNPNYAEQRKESIKEKLSENQKTVARKEAEQPKREHQNREKRRDQER